MQIQANNQSFNGSYRMYFYTNDGKRIVSDENMKKCLHYVEAHLNGSKRVKQYNKDLIDTFSYGQKDKAGNRVGGDVDYVLNPKIRAVYKRLKDRTDGFIRIVTGHDADKISNQYGKPIGKAKRMSRERTGSMDTFETKDALDRYFDRAVQYSDNRNKNEKAFGVAFTPVYKKNGDLKGFEYHHSGYFDESKINKNAETL